MIEPQRKVVRALAEAWRDFPDEIPHDPSDPQTVAGRLQRVHGIKDPDVLRAWLTPGKEPEDLPGDVPFLGRELSTAAGHLTVALGSFHRAVLQRNVRGILSATIEFLTTMRIVGQGYWDRTYANRILPSADIAADMLRKALRNTPPALYYPDAEQSTSRGAVARLQAQADDLLTLIGQRTRASDNIPLIGPERWEEMTRLIQLILRELTVGYPSNDVFNDLLQDAVDELAVVRNELENYAEIVDD